MLNKIIISVFLILNSPLLASDIIIAVAANVSYAINDLKKEFNKKYPDIKVKVVLGSSGKLTAQIKHGAPYQLFMSANMDFPKALYKEKLAISKPKIYARGALSIFSIKKQDFSLGIDVIKSKNIDKIAIANPKTAPYGKATLEAIKNSKLYDKVNKKFVYAESISQTISYTITATDIGFIAKSALYSKQMSMYKDKINYTDVDTKLYTPIKQGIVILKNAKDNADVKAFYTFMLSNDAKGILQRFGYLAS